MPISIGWDIELDSALIIEFQGELNWDEFESIGEKARQLASEKQHPVHIVQDLSVCNPPARSPILHLRRFSASLPPNALEGVTVYVGATTYWRACITTFARVYPQLMPDVVYVSDMDSARDAVRKKIEQIEMLAEDDDDEPFVSQSGTSLNSRPFSS
jgi:hypothetical protein